MAKENDMSFPRFIDRPRLFLMFEIDEIFYSLGVAALIAVPILFATANVLYMLLIFIFVVPLVRAVVVETKKHSGLQGSFDYIKYAAGYTGVFPFKREQVLKRWPELKDVDNMDFLANGFQDEFYS